MLIFFTADFGVARVLDRASIAKSFCGEFMISFSAVTSRSSGTITLLYILPSMPLLLVL